MSNVYVGQIMMFGGNFALRGFSFCNGQLLSIAQNQALFALIGTTYGGDGVSTFALPNLQSRLAVNVGHGPALSNYVIGQTGGSANVTLDPTTMPSHMHSLIATVGPANTGTIGSGVFPATTTGTSNAQFYAAQVQGQPILTPVAMNPAVCSNAGGSQPHSNLMPSLCISFVIALQGMFPSRN